MDAVIVDRPLQRFKLMQGTKVVGRNMHQATHLGCSFIVACLSTWPLESNDSDMIRVKRTREKNREPLMVELSHCRRGSMLPAIFSALYGLISYYNLPWSVNVAKIRTSYLISSSSSTGCAISKGCNSPTDIGWLERVIA